MRAFDDTATQFDRFRALPEGVPAAIREALWAELPGNGRLLDLGAGTGRVGLAFVAAGDDYVGVDASARMLAEFHRKCRDAGMPVPRLVQADGRALPLEDACCDVVLVVQVLSGVTGWRALLVEARRVLRPGGALVLGQTASPPAGLDAQLRSRGAEILESMGIAAGRRGAERGEAAAWLERQAFPCTRLVAARWESPRSPAEFLARHATGARFAALATEVREQALARLADWARDRFGTLESVTLEPFTFELEVFRFS